MQNSFVCLCCGKMTKLPGFKIQGKALGQSLIDLLVCGPCHERYHANMKEFWGKPDLTVGNTCPRCSARLTSQNSRLAYRKRDGISTDDTCVLCDVCYPEYIKACLSAAAKK